MAVHLGKSALYATQVGEITRAVLHLIYNTNIAGLEECGHKPDFIL